MPVPQIAQRCVYVGSSGATSNIEGHLKVLTRPRAPGQQGVDYARMRTRGKIAPTMYSVGRAVAQVRTSWVGAFWSLSLPGVFGTRVAVAAPTAVTLYVCSLMFD